MKTWKRADTQARPFIRPGAIVLQGVLVVNQVKVVSLDDVLSSAEQAIGPKAMSLVRLKKIGLTVPVGFCVTESALREHLEQNNLAEQLQSAVDELAKAKTGAREAILSDLRQAITDAPLAEQVRREIENHYRKLGAERVAVRSSGTAEDLPGYS
ncbi:MAG: PEP/pyruvate-binding domain-containing protein, partial [Planctomycetota bacterium]